MEKEKAIQETQAYWIMTTPVQTVRTSDLIREVVGLFNEKNISAAAVLDENHKPVGVITKTDIVRREQERNAKNKAEDWMTPVIFTVKPETSIREIARRMVKYGVHHIFVKGKNGEPLVGIISSFDILMQVARTEPMRHA